MGQEFRCPKCQRLTAPQDITYSEGLNAFVCPECKANAVGLGGPTTTWQSTRPLVPTPPPPPGEIDFTPPPPDAHATHAHVKHTSAWLVPTIGLIVAAALITGAAIWIFRTPSAKPIAAMDNQRAWEDSHHDEIVKLKSQAEALALEGNLPEAHSRYRELEKLVGGRKVKDASLFDLVEVARQDQDRIYKLLLQRMADAQQQQTPITAPATSETPADEQRETDAAKFVPSGIDAPTPQTRPDKSYPSSYDALRGGADATAATSAPTTAPIAQAPPAAPVPIAEILPMPRGAVTDEEIGEAIQRGVDFLLSQFDEKGEIRTEGGNDAHKAGLDALCVYALAASGRAIVDPRLSARGPEMDRMLDRLKEYKLERGEQVNNVLTYARALRANALAVYNRPQDRDVLTDDVNWLVNAQSDGAYTYDDRFSPPFKSKLKRPPTTRRAPSGRSPIPARRAALSDADVFDPVDRMGEIILTDGTFTPRPALPALVAPQLVKPSSPFTNQLPQGTKAPPPKKFRSAFPWDNSNSQYGLLGVWAGAELAIEVPDRYWRQVDTHWKSHQVPSGEWYYSDFDRDPRFTMTCAALASLLVTHDYLEAPLLASSRTFNREPYSPQVRAGLAWLEEADHSINIMSEPLFYVGYNLFSLERVGLASGLKHFGGHDWFVELAAKTLKTQWPNGSFGLDDQGQHAQIDTAFTLLFLSRGRHPIIANKLRFDGFWSNRPREIANLAAYASRELERTVNWQVVDIQREAHEWLDSPILYISSHKALSFDRDQMAKLSDFVDYGGIIFTHADISSGEFDRSVTSLAKQLFPAYELKDLPPEHPLYKLNYTINTPRPRIQAVSNGARLLLVHSPTDISSAWQLRATMSRKEAFYLGVNLYLYATGKERFRNRLDTTVVYAPQQPAAREIQFARLKYDGNWDPEPRAWVRFATKFQWDTGDGIDVKPTAIEQLSYTEFGVAHLTGTDTFNPSEAQLAAMKLFVETGGTLLIDACGGSGAFADAENSWLPKLLGEKKLETLPADDALYKKTVALTVDAPSKALRLYALEQLRSPNSRIKAAAVGKGRVIFSALDITSGLLATNTWGILGYSPEFADAVAHNLMVLANPR